MNELLEKALRIAVEAHTGQVDKAGKPYIFHPLRVCTRCFTDEEKIVALLHDTIEDTTVMAEELLAAGFPVNIVDAILSVSRREGESYEDFTRRAGQNPLGRVVKLHDLEDNMDISRLERVSDEDIDRLNRYVWAYRYLCGLQDACKVNESNN